MTPPKATVDFTEIESDQGLRFEQFVEALLRALGWTIIAGAGKGPDGGRDIIAAETETTATGRERIRKFVIQCKHHATSRRSVYPNDITNFELVPEVHQCDGWLLVTSTQLTTNTVDLIEAAGRRSPQYVFDYWHSGDLRDRLTREKCRKVFADYLPASYARFAHILTPSPAEIRMLVSGWLDARNDRGDLFSLDYDSDNSLLGFAATRGQTLEDIRALLADEELSDEFLAVWPRPVPRGNVRAPGVVLLNGLRRLDQLRRKGLPEEARHRLLLVEIFRMVEHRDYVRRCLNELVVYAGTAPSWTTIRATPGNGYFSPAARAVEFAFFCADRDQGASGQVRFGNTVIPFIASYSVESQIQLELHSLDLEFEVMTDPGSDAIVIAVLGFSE